MIRVHSEYKLCNVFRKTNIQAMVSGFIKFHGIVWIFCSNGLRIVREFIGRNIIILMVGHEGLKFWGCEEQASILLCYFLYFLVKCRRYKSYTKLLAYLTLPLYGYNFFLNEHNTYCDYIFHRIYYLIYYQYSMEYVNNYYNE